MHRMLCGPEDHAGASPYRVITMAEVEVKPKHDLVKVEFQV